MEDVGVSLLFFFGCWRQTVDGWLVLEIRILLSISAVQFNLDGIDGLRMKIDLLISGFSSTLFRLSIVSC